MATLLEFPYNEVEFSKSGAIANPGLATVLQAELSHNAISDLIVISHGWNNDMAEARDLYQRFLARVRSIIKANAVPGTQQRRFAVLAVLWPSKRFTGKAAKAGGAATFAATLATADIKQELEALKALFPDQIDRLDKAAALVDNLGDSPAAQREFVGHIRALLGPEQSPDMIPTKTFFNLPGDELLRRFNQPLPLTGGSASAGAAGTGGAAGGIASGGAEGVRNFLNYFTYYEMKERAGLIGSTGLHQLLRALAAKLPALRTHLIGHSFGGRLMTAAAAGPANGSPLEIGTLTLLQAAFSHYGFAEKYDGSQDGFFRRVLTGKRVRGPILVSHTRNDTSVGMMYPLASMFMGQAGSATGDENDLYGGLGANGAQKTPEAIKDHLLAVGGAYQLKPGKLHNLLADAVITGHSDICHDEVAYAVLAAIAATP